MPADLFFSRDYINNKKREGNTSYNECGMNNYMYQLIPQADAT